MPLNWTRLTGDFFAKYVIINANSTSQVQDQEVSRTRWNFGAKPRLMTRYKPLKGRTVARATCKPKAKICAAMGIARYKRQRCAKLRDHPTTPVGQTAIIWQFQRQCLGWKIAACSFLLGVRGWAKYTWTPQTDYLTRETVGRHVKQSRACANWLVTNT